MDMAANNIVFAHKRTATFQLDVDRTVLRLVILNLIYFTSKYGSNYYINFKDYIYRGFELKFQKKKSKFNM